MIKLFACFENASNGSGSYLKCSFQRNAGTDQKHSKRIKYIYSYQPCCSFQCKGYYIFCHILGICVIFVFLFGMLLYVQKVNWSPSIPSGGYVVNLLFLILGVVITRKILAFHGSTIYEQIVISSFIATCLYLLTYDILEQFTPDCNLMLRNKTSNEVFWFVSRSVSMYIWSIPIVYIFWPQLTSNSRHIPSTADGSNASYSSKGHRSNQSYNKINHTKSNKPNHQSEQRSSIISSLDEELSDDDEFYNSGNAQLQQLTTAHSNKQIILGGKNKANFNSLIFGRKSNKGPNSLRKTTRFMSTNSHQSINIDEEDYTVDNHINLLK
ncbi:UNKNOWN [Stylonychia lemnae]|uniref:Uncharacterized protein n=1 Tax=Stylonychia lemnae TaxID=5949 RepID=A0A078A421_STYLE|nr:UNKNOWN [Stylonychia lemnae]|eukprot:CDW76624.1 UNKNOWN [Stylonychia lemnae]